MNVGQKGKREDRKWRNFFFVTIFQAVSKHSKAGQNKGYFLDGFEWQNGHFLGFLRMCKLLWGLKGCKMPLLNHMNSQVIKHINKHATYSQTHKEISLAWYTICKANQTFLSLLVYTITLLKFFYWIRFSKFIELKKIFIIVIRGQWD